MKRLFILLALWMGFQGCKKQFSDARYDSTDQLQIMDYIDGRDDISIFRELVDYLGQRNLLKTAGTYTLFIPNNAAFERLFSQLSAAGSPVTAIADLPPEVWQNYFRYHLLEQKINTNELIQGPLPAPTVYDDRYIVADIRDSYASIKLNNASTILEYNVELSNGYVNITDEVLMPPVESIFDALEKTGKYTIMLDVFEEAGFTSYLKDSTITVLIESDEALIRSDFSPESITDLKSWVEYHIIPDSGYFLNMLTRQRFYSLYPSEALTFQEDDFGQYYVNETFPFDQSREIGIDRICSNGTYHTLDTVMPIVDARQATVRMNLYPPGSPYGEQNVFTVAPARIVSNNGTQSYHQNREGRIVQFDATQVGDYFWMTVPDVPAGKYSIRLIYRASGLRGQLLSIYNNQIIKDGINFGVRDGFFEDWDYLSYKDCGEINVEERSDVTINFAFIGFGTNPNPSYCCDILMDIVELIPVFDN